MADENSIKRYQDTLKAYRESQGILDDMGLPETTENPVQDMIDQANTELVDQKAIEAQAKLDEQKLKNSNNLLADYNLDESEEDRITGTIENSVKSGSMGKEDLENLKTLKENTTEREIAPEKPVIAPVSSSPTESVSQSTPDRQALLEQVRQLRAERDKANETPELSTLEQARKDRAMQESFADISEGISKFGAGYAGGGLTQLKADTSMADLMRKRAQRGYTETEKEVSEAKADEKAAIEADAESERKAKIDELNTRYKNAQIANMLKKDEAAGGLSVDPNSDESKATAKRYTKMYPGLDFTDLSAKDIVDNVKNRISNRRIEEYYVPKTEQGAERITNTEKERSKKWFNDNQEDLKKSVKQFNSDKEVVRANSMISGSKIARDMVESGNPIAAASIPNFLARASGEVGALTEADKEPFGGTRAIIERAKQAVQQMTSGTLTAANKKFVLDLSKIYEKTANGVKEGRADEMARQIGGVDFPLEMVRGRFLGTDTTSLLDDKVTDDKDPKIEQYAKQYNIDYTKAEQLLRSRGYGKK